jgi:hypothetical protein
MPTRLALVVFAAGAAAFGPAAVRFAPPAGGAGVSAAAAARRTSPLAAAARRDFLGGALSAAAACAALPAGSAQAAEDEAPKPTRSEAFARVRAEVVTGKEAGGATLPGLIDGDDWEEVKEFTKKYDNNFRKMMMLPAKKTLETSSLKEKGQLLCNAVTFDLIAINKAARVGDKPAALAALARLRADAEKFVALEAEDRA